MNNGKNKKDEIMMQTDEFTISQIEKKQFSSSQRSNSDTKNNDVKIVIDDDDPYRGGRVQQ